MRSLIMPRYCVCFIVEVEEDNSIKQGFEDKKIIPLFQSPEIPKPHPRHNNTLSGVYTASFFKHIKSQTAFVAGAKTDSVSNQCQHSTAISITEQSSNAESSDESCILSMGNTPSKGDLLSADLIAARKKNSKIFHNESQALQSYPISKAMQFDQIQQDLQFEMVNNHGFEQTTDLISDSFIMQAIHEAQNVGTQTNNMPLYNSTTQTPERHIDVSVAESDSQQIFQDPLSNFKMDTIPKVPLLYPHIQSFKPPTKFEKHQLIKDMELKKETKHLPLLPASGDNQIRSLYVRPSPYHRPKPKVGLNIPETDSMFPNHKFKRTDSSPLKERRDISKAFPHSPILTPWMHQPNSMNLQQGICHEKNLKVYSDGKCESDIEDRLPNFNEHECSSEISSVSSLEQNSSRSSSPKSDKCPFKSTAEDIKTTQKEYLNKITTRQMVNTNARQTNSADLIMNNSFQMQKLILSTSKFCKKQSEVDIYSLWHPRPPPSPPPINDQEPLRPQSPETPNASCWPHTVSPGILFKQHQKDSKQLSCNVSTESLLPVRKSRSKIRIPMEDVQNRTDKEDEKIPFKPVKRKLFSMKTRASSTPNIIQMNNDLTPRKQSLAEEEILLDEEFPSMEQILVEEEILPMELPKPAEEIAKFQHEDCLHFSTKTRISSSRQKPTQIMVDKTVENKSVPLKLPLKPIVHRPSTMGRLKKQNIIQLKPPSGRIIISPLETQTETCFVKNLVKKKFYLPEMSKLEDILADTDDRRIKSICTRFNCELEVYSKVPRRGILQDVLTLSAVNLDDIRKCTRSLDNRLKWSLYPQIK